MCEDSWSYPQPITNKDTEDKITQRAAILYVVCLSEAHELTPNQLHVLSMDMEYYDKGQVYVHVVCLSKRTEAHELTPNQLHVLSMDMEYYDKGQVYVHVVCLSKRTDAHELTPNQLHVLSMDTEYYDKGQVYVHVVCLSKRTHEATCYQLHAQNKDTERH